MQIPPMIPEGFVVSILVQKPGKLINVIRKQPTQQQASQSVQAGVSQAVDLMERGKTKAFELPLDPPRPELIEIAGIQSGKSLTPEAKMKIDRHWQFRVEGLPAPLPLALARQGR